jgi:hypothetical protein
MPTPATPPTPTPIEWEVTSTQGFGYTYMGGVSPEKVLVLRQGTSANITVKISSHYNESCRISLSLSFYGGVEGIIYSEIAARRHGLLNAYFGGRVKCA